jgi:hypothetical protein
MYTATRFFSITAPQGQSTIKLDSKGYGTCQITVKNVSSTAIDGRGTLVSLPVTRPPAGAVENGWVTIAGPAVRRFDVDAEEVFSVKIAVPQLKKGVPPRPAGNYNFRLNVVNVARPDDSADQSQALNFAVAASTPPPPSRLPLILALAAVVLLVASVATWLLLRKPNSPAILGIGPGQDLWTRTTPTSPWVQIPNSCCVTGVSVMANGTIVGIGLDKFLWTRANLSSPWGQVPNSCCVTGVSVIADGTIVGIGLDKFLWTRANLNSLWVQVPNSCCVTGVSVMADGTIVGIGLDKFLWTRANLNSPWVQVPNSCCVTGVSVMADGTILGIGLGQDLWTRSTLSSQWVHIPDSGLVIAIAAGHK